MASIQHLVNIGVITGDVAQQFAGLSNQKAPRIQVILRQIKSDRGRIDIGRHVSSDVPWDGE